MAMSHAGQVSGLLKSGSQHMKGVEDAICRNIEACKGLATITRSSLGPNGMSKIIINHLDKKYVTCDAATIVKELEVIHPAAKLMVLASEMQEQEIGDGTNFVIIFSGELLQNAESLLRMGLHPSEIIQGYEKALKYVELNLETYITYTLDNIRDHKRLSQLLRGALSSEDGIGDLLAPHLARACIDIMPTDPKNFQIENVRVAKILGGGVLNTEIIKGFVITRDSVGPIKHVLNAKVAIFSCALAAGTTESKGTVLINTADELKNYNISEENNIEKIIKEISSVGVNVIVCDGSVDDMALHFCQRYKIMIVKVSSKFDIRRLCKAVGATQLVRLGAPTAEELGHCDSVSVEEVGGTKITVFKQNLEDSGISTVIVRASTRHLLDDIERLVDDGVNVVKGITRDARFLTGGGAVEIELSRALDRYAATFPGLEQYAIKRFAEAFEVVPRTLAENSGRRATEVISSLYALHEKGQTSMGINVDIEGDSIVNMIDMNIYDLYISKLNAIRLAVDAVITVLRVDQMIVAKRAGGPKAPQQNPNWDDDD